MFISTYSADSVRGYRNQGKEITLPVTFTSIATISSNLDYNPSNTNPFQITADGGLIFISASNTATGNIRLISGQWTTNNIINTGEIVPFAVNGTGNIIYQVGGNVANTKLVLNSQSSYYGYTEVANINVGANVSIRKISSDYGGNTVAIVTQAASSNNYFVNIYDYNGTNLTLQTNIDLGVNAFGTANVYMNPSGNVVVMTHSEASNVQVHTKSGNTWSLQANITNNNKIFNCFVNNFGNILLLNTSNLSNDQTRLYTLSGNTWSLSQTFTSNISGNTSNRGRLSTTNDGNIISCEIVYSNANPVTEIIQYDNANANYSITQNITLTRDAVLTSEPGYVFMTQSGSAGFIEVYSCL